MTIPASFRYGVANSADQVRERVRAILKGGADFIKILATGAVFTRGTKSGVSECTEDQIRAAVEQAAEYGTFVAAHAHGAEGINRAAPGWWPISGTATIPIASAGSRNGLRTSCGRTPRPPRSRRDRQRDLPPWAQRDAGSVHGQVRHVTHAGDPVRDEALRSLGRETELVIYPGEYHEIRKPSYRRDRLHRYQAWYSRYLKRGAQAATH